MTHKAVKKRPYRKGVGAVLFNAEGFVFVGRRIDTRTEAWQLPQGGIDDREKPRHAVLRELVEEVGTNKAEIVAQSSRWLTYDLPEDLAGRVWGGRYRGQKQRWFALRFTGTDADIDVQAGGHPEFNAWRWAPIETLLTMTVWFKRSMYEEIVREFGPLVLGAAKAAVEAAPP